MPNMDAKPETDELGETLTQWVADELRGLTWCTGGLYRLAQVMRDDFGLTWAEACDRIARMVEAQAQDMTASRFGPER
jgi:hypothetical protein